MNETILAVGAGGKFAGLVIPELAKRGARVRGLVHDGADGPAVRAAGAHDVVVGDLTDPASVAAALRGVDRVFYIAPVALPGEAEVGELFVAAAIDAGVRRFVFSSVIHPVLSRLPNHALKAPIEEAVLNSHLEYTFLHPTVLFQNYAGVWDEIITSGVVAEPWSNETRFSRVDYRDVAEVAAIALTEDRLLYGALELCAEGWLDRHDVAALIGAVLGRPVTARRIDPASLPAAAQAMRPMFDHYDKVGLRGNALTLAAILGRSPRTLRAYFEELAAASIAATKGSEERNCRATLFSPLRVGALDLPNRIWMSAMTRTRATEDNVPTAAMAEYFAQRADAGLIVTDCTAVSRQARGVIRGPGIWRDDQIAGWRLVTDRVRQAGGRIVCQLWHCGRVAHPDMRDGEMPVAPSPIPASGDFHLPSGKVDFPVPRELGIAEIPGIIEDFAQATRNARTAGFDGVELHGANGYLHDQFLQDGSNKRSDAYGGSAQNRARLMVETTQAMIEAWDADHVGVRLSPSSSLYGVDDSNQPETFATVIDALNALGIAYLTLLEPNAKDAEKGVQIEHVAETFRSRVTAPLVVNTGFDKAKGAAAIAGGAADAVAFGVAYIANPDLVERLRADAPLNRPDPSTFYGAGAEGYTDYPALAFVEAV